MFIRALQLATPLLTSQRIFYRETLGLPLTQTTETSFTVQAGTTFLTFASSAEDNISYHFAFTVPWNKWKQAKDWLTARVPLLSYQGEDEFSSARVRTSNLYFLDPAGNILEFIARHDLPAKDGEAFGVEDILHVSEIGLVVDNVSEQVEKLKTLMGIEVYRGSFFENFAQLGDINGVLILVKKGRLWAPTQEIPAVVAPVHVTILGTQAQQIHLDPYPYTIEVEPLSAHLKSQS